MRVGRVEDECWVEIRSLCVQLGRQKKIFLSIFLFFFILGRVERALNQKAADNTYAEAVDYSQFFFPPRNPISSYENWVGEWAKHTTMRVKRIFPTTTTTEKRWMSETKLPRRVSSEQYFSTHASPAHPHSWWEKWNKRQQISHLILNKKQCCCRFTYALCSNSAPLPP